MPDPPPPRLKHAAIKYAEYALWLRRNGLDRAKQIYDEWIAPAQRWLERVARGEETIAPVDDGPALVVSDAMRTRRDDGGIMM